MNPAKNKDMCGVSWDDVQDFCEHSGFLDPLCGRRMSPGDFEAVFMRARSVESLSHRVRLLDEFPEVVMSTVEQVATYPKEQILTWDVTSYKHTSSRFSICVTLYLK